MATADELLNGGSSEVYFIDVNAREVTIPKDRNVLGVESDDEVQKLRFAINRYYNGIDLSEYDIRINYKNADGDPDLSSATDIVVSDDTIEFTWVVQRFAFAVAGNVSFNICLRKINDGIVDSEFNTTPATMTVLPGLEVDAAQVVEDYPDAISVIASEVLKQSGQNISPIAIGEYLNLGIDESGQPILWRCVGMRNEGPLMVSDKILTYKAFGASEKDSFIPAEDPTNTTEVRQRYGKGMWSTSALRLWLNTSGSIPWADEKKTLRPSDYKVTANPYNLQKGFCTGFTDDELTFVTMVRNDSAVNEYDESSAYTGHLPHKLYVGQYIDQNTQNYFGSAYLQCTHDLFFCLNTAEVVEVHKNLAGYTKAHPTDHASDMCESKYADGEGNSYYWLRDAYAVTEFPECVRCVYPSGRPYQYNVNNGNIGVRPAFVLAKGGFDYGCGTAADPYRLTDPARDSSPITLQENKKPARPFEKVKTPTDIAGVYVGDYIKMGEIDGAGILWRCVDVDDNGPLFVSDKALRFFPFSGRNEDDPINMRQDKGTNRWKHSAIRCWLNSNGQIDWDNSDAKDYVPTSDNVYGGYSHYEDQEGFMSCFTPTEQKAIKTSRIQSAINICDVAEELGVDINAEGVADKTFIRTSTYGKVTLTEGYNPDALAGVVVEDLFTATAHPDSCYAGENGNKLSIAFYITDSKVGQLRAYVDGAHKATWGLGTISADNNFGQALYKTLTGTKKDVPMVDGAGTNLCMFSVCAGKTEDDFAAILGISDSINYADYTYQFAGGCGGTVIMDTTADKMFLLNHQQLKRIYEQFEDYILARPTPGAVAYCNKDNHKYPVAFRADSNEGKTWHYWTRDAFSNLDSGKDYNCNLVCDITTDGRIGQDNAYDGQYGIRPAFYAAVDNRHVMVITGGSGTETDPYTVKRNN